MNNQYNICVKGNRRYHYNSKKIIGKGKYSNVYTGIIEDTNENIAVKKICLNKISKDYEIVIDREITTIDKLMKLQQNDNILKYYEVIRINNYVYIIMELCINGNLSSILINPIKEKYVKYYFTQIVNGLDWIHTNGIIHNDIKPDNILITDNYRTLKICDFGFSNQFNDKNDNIICGTPIYMAPEILKYKNSDTYSDIWSLGIILYELVYGYHPYKSVKDIKSIILYLKYIKIKKNDNISNNGIIILNSLLAYNFKKRIQIIDIINNIWLSNNININEILLSYIYYKPKNTNISHSLPDLTKNFNKFDDVIIHSQSMLTYDMTSINNVLFNGYLENMKDSNNIDNNGHIYETITIDDKHDDLIFSMDII